MCCRQQLFLYSHRTFDTEWIIGVNVVTGGDLCVLQTEVASLQTPDCNTEWIIGVNVVTGGVFCVLKTAVASLQSPDCDTDWIIGVNVVTGGICVCCRQKVLFYSHRTVILSG